MEIFFVLGFFVMLLLTGVSLLGIILALAVAAVWIYRAYRKPPSKTARWISR
jgi:hypothetical protein